MSYLNYHSDESGKDESSQGEEFSMKHENDSTYSDENNEQIKFYPKLIFSFFILQEKYPMRPHTRMQFQYHHVY